MSNRTQAGSEPYAHLKARRGAAKDGLPPDTDAKGKKAEDGGDLDDDDENEKKKKDDLDDKKDKTEDEDAPGGKKSKKAKSKKAEEDEGEGDGDDDDEVEAARKAERARCSAIFLSPHAAGRVDAACVLAFDTDMSANKAIKTLKALGSSEPVSSSKKSSADEERATERRALRERMESQPNANVGDDIEKKPEPTGAKAFAERMKQVNAIRHGQA